MTARTPIHDLQVANELYEFINREVLPDVGVDQAHFWQGFSAIVTELAPKNAALLAERERLQKELDTWHAANPGPIKDMRAYRAFLERIGYLVPQPAKPLLALPMSSEMVQALPMRRLPKFIRDVIVLSPKVAGVHWMQWELSGRGQVDELVGLARRKHSAVLSPVA